MASIHSNGDSPDVTPEAAPDKPSATNGRMHRIRSVREQQGLSLRAVARRMDVDVCLVKSQENETSNLRLSELYEWQNILDVPVEELLVDAENPLSRPVMERAQLLRLMKSAAAILEEARTPGIRRMAQNLVDQLIEMMPELQFVSSWHAVGQRRSLDDYGRTLERRLPEDMFHRHQPE